MSFTFASQRQFISGFNGILGLLALFFVAHAVEADTNTPYSKGTRVAVTSPTGTIEGLLQDSNHPDWLMIIQDGRPEITAVKLGPGVAIKSIKNINKLSTLEYWKNASSVLRELCASKDDPSPWWVDKKPPSTPDSPVWPGSPRILKEAAKKLGSLPSEGVDREALDCIKITIKCLEICEKQNDDMFSGRFIAQSAAMSFGGQGPQSVQMSMNRAKEGRDALKEMYSKSTSVREHLEKTYKCEFTKLMLPKP